MNELARRPAPFMTADEFLLWPGDGTGRRFYLVGGEVRAMSRASSTHSVIQGNLYSLLRAAARALDPELQVIVEGAIVPALSARDNVRVPDMVVRRGRTTRNEIALPNPIAVVEVLSPGNTPATRENVRAYATLASVQEILVVSTSRIELELLRRGPAAEWPPDPLVIRSGGTLEIDTAALRCAVEDVYEGTWLLDP